MHETAERIIDAGRVEQSERPLGAEVEFAVRGLVADRGQRRHGKETREFGRVGAAARHLVAAFDHVRIGNLLRANADLDRGAVLRHERLKLLEQISSEVPRLGNRRCVNASLAELGESARARGRLPVGRISQAQFGIPEQGPRRRRRRLAVLKKALHCAMQRLRRLIVQANEPVDRLMGGFQPLERTP